MSTFGDVLARVRSDGTGALFPYMMAGLFDDDATLGIFEAMAEAGARGFEVGIPYADPLMDGPVIQEAGARALDNGMTLGRGLELAGRVAAATGKPCAVMTYVNPVLTMGPDEFARRVAEFGGGAAILADLPVDEAGPFMETFAEHGVGLVQFAAPTTTDDRLDRVVAAADPFVYGIAEMGVTGERDGSTSRASELAARIRDRSAVPLVFGVGISSAATAVAALEHGDGVIVGTALVRRALAGDTAAEAARTTSELVGEITAALRAGSPS